VHNEYVYVSFLHIELPLKQESEFEPYQVADDQAGCFSLDQARELGPRRNLFCPDPVETSRFDDLVDILVFACIDGDLLAERLCAAIRAVSEAREDHIPTRLVQIPISWRPKFDQFLKKLDFPSPTSMMLFRLLKASSILYVTGHVAELGIQKAGNGKAAR
jgi:hypothetical protein